MDLHLTAREALLRRRLRMLKLGELSLTGAWRASPGVSEDTLRWFARAINERMCETDPTTIHVPTLLASVEMIMVDPEFALALRGHLPMVFFARWKPGADYSNVVLVFVVAMRRMGLSGYCCVAAYDSSGHGAYVSRVCSI